MNKKLHPAHMSANLHSAVTSACIRMLNHMSNYISIQPDDYAQQMMLDNITDIASVLKSLNHNDVFYAHPDVLAEALAYECKKQQPDPTIIMDLTFMLRS
jgi:hypothetical protein